MAFDPLSRELRQKPLWFAQAPSPPPKGFPPEDPNRSGFRQVLPDSRSYQSFKPLGGNQNHGAWSSFYMNACNGAASFAGSCFTAPQSSFPPLANHNDNRSIKDLQQDFGFWIRKQEMDKAKQVVNNSQKKFPQSAETFMMKIDYQMASHQQQAAISAAEEWIQAIPSDPRSHTALLGLLVNSDQKEKAIQHVNAMVKEEELDELDDWVIDFAIISYFTTKKYEDCRRFLKEARERRPDFVDYQLTDAAIDLNQDNIEKAQISVDAVLLKDSTNYMANYIKGSVLLNGEESPEKAYPYFQHCYDEWTKSGDPIQKPLEAFSQFRWIQDRFFLDVYPEAIWFVLGKHQLATKNYKEAEAYFKKAIGGDHLPEKMKSEVKTDLQMVELYLGTTPPPVE